ncbi:hypothetical protein EVAR_68063_1 [Eumeta japonica]|uniref:Uncharacterized protein n=1 Tax=Eumeta variegata TaxID=151549 RepID=A0A4C1ZSB8_EUMVA|nr:hypothetical protein EVAR_68063_1 [Eumeta japonica]
MVTIEDFVSAVGFMIDTDKRAADLDKLSPIRVRSKDTFGSVTAAHGGYKLAAVFVSGRFAKKIRTNI